MKPLLCEEAERMFSCPASRIAVEVRADMRVLEELLLTHAKTFDVWDELMSHWFVKKLFLASYRTRLF